MLFKKIRLPLFNEIFYSYSTALDGNTFTLEFLFVERLESWIFTLRDSDQTALVSGARLTPNTTLFQDYQLEGIAGAFYFTPKTDLNIEDALEQIRNPRDFFTLYYVYESGE